MTALAMAAGALIGLGLGLIALELFPAPPHLGIALARQHGTPVPDRYPLLSTVRNKAAFAMPDADLELTGVTQQNLVAKRLGYLALGAAMPQLLGALAALAGAGVGWFAQGLACLVFAAFFGLTPDIAVRRRAAEQRAEFRAGLSTFLDLVALERAGGAGSSEALYGPLGICSGWVFTLIDDTLQEARNSGRQPWQDLGVLGQRIDIPELTDLADIAEDAGSAGAQVMSTLLAKAQSMRAAALTDARAKANSRTGEMPVAIALSLIGFMLLIGFPSVYQLFLR